MSEETETTTEDDGTVGLHELIASMGQAQKDYLLSIFFLLQQSDRYNEFVEDNYDIQKVIDHENQMIDVRIEEKEAAPYYKMTVGKTLRIHSLLCQAGLEKGSAIVEEIIHTIKSDEEEPLIITADQGMSSAISAARDDQILSEVVTDFKKGPKQ